MNLRALAGAAALAAGLAACSGGGGNPGECFASSETCAGVEPGAPAAGGDSALGLFKGTLGTGRIAYALVLSTGDIWLLYGSPGPSATLVGAEHGTYTAAQGVISSGNLVDFSSESTQVTAGSLAGNYATAASLSGTVSLPLQTFSFATLYDPNSTTQGTLAAVAGSYAGASAQPGRQDAATAAVTSDGVIAGSTASGCNFSGNLLAGAGINTYAASLTFTGAGCPDNPFLTAGTGVAVLEGTRLYVAVFNAAQTSGFTFSGGR